MESYWKVLFVGFLISFAFFILSLSLTDLYKDDKIEIQSTEEILYKVSECAATCRYNIPNLTDQQTEIYSMGCLSYCKKDAN